MNQLNTDILNYTLEFLTNEEIMNFIYVNKEIYKLFDKKKIFEFMNTRNHPIVFNNNDVYCLYCNQGLIFLDDEIHKYHIQCNH